MVPWWVTALSTVITLLCTLGAALLTARAFLAIRDKEEAAPLFVGAAAFGIILAIGLAVSPP